MTIKVALEHRTTYRFDRPVALGPHVVRLRPAPHTRTPVTAYSLRVRPTEHFLNWQQDPYGNHLARLVFPERTTELEIVVDLVAEMTVINPFDFFLEEYAETVPFGYQPALHSDLAAYLGQPGDTRDDRAVRGWIADHALAPSDGERTVDFLIRLNQQLSRDVRYTVRMEPGVHSPAETLDLAIGSCRDSAWLLVAALRELGLAARFVSGYLVQLVPDPGADGRGVPGLTEDFTDLHAWAEVFLPGAGWVGLDATSGLLAGEGHIPLSATPQAAQSAPITGWTDPAETTMEFHNVVRRVHEDPRVTAPYSPGQLERIHALGSAVDRQLDAGDVRLTMGGEPTFVSVDDMDAEEWNVAADGVDKRARAQALARRLLVEEADAGGVLTHGQGKWYPGEPLPRWQVGVSWRVDGEPLWRDRSLLDDPWGAPVLTPGSAEAADKVAALTASIAESLGVPPEFAVPLFEDPLVRILDEAGTPKGDPPARDVDPAAVWLADPDARARLVAGLDGEDGRPVGWAVPLHRTPDGAAWATTRWTTRRGRLVLLPGTSPAGLRLPIGSISWTARPGAPAPAAMVPLPPLPPAPPWSRGAGDPGAGDAGASPPRAKVTSVRVAPTTALCVEERAGHVFVFLPPVEETAPALDLLAAIEQAAVRCGVPVVLEGYPLPGDPRIRSTTVTPDPGVVEVNVAPSSTWAELADSTARLYRLAHEVGLGADKFALDGTHTGTGGGSHLTLGGPTPADSPLLRRPDLLVSLLTFWQHHPALSYLFSGRFIGPTSQSPRVDEGRHETLYELEIAFAELARLPDPRPWQADRALRHLLTDITGNTHRSEFCIDKMYSPDSERGRLGLLELRGFEMAPHPSMALVQALLVRALVARFWAAPYSGGLVRWGTRLHDEFLLPAFVRQDMADVVSDLQAHGIDFDPAWLEPFYEFRFPLLGATDVDGVRIELRQAIEPWHVLGEEVTGSGTARYVDSSLERVQLAVRGAVEGRHLMTCNGVPVPLHVTRDAGTLVAGVRYRAWAPPSALHPTIGVQSPLVFDLVDRWSGRSLGGCTYHVVHPGGRAFDAMPVNAAEAESRRAARFRAEGHTPGPLDPQLLSGARPVGQGGTDPEYRVTLDLRRAAGS
jgi:uncharacterized protein (DUF2126 family)/transglutaminase-like putative cysteine protease